MKKVSERKNNPRSNRIKCKENGIPPIPDQFLLQKSDIQHMSRFINFSIESTFDLSSSLAGKIELITYESLREDEVAQLLDSFL